MNQYTPHLVIALIGSVAAIGGSFAAKNLGAINGNVAAMIAFAGVLSAVGALVTALAGLISQIATNMLSMMKLWIDNRRAERLEKLDRKQLIERIEFNNTMINDLRTLLDEYRDRVEKQKSRLDDQHILIKSFYDWKKKPLKLEEPSTEAPESPPLLEPTPE